MKTITDYEEGITYLMKTIKFLADKNNLPLEAIVEDFKLIMMAVE